MCSSVSYTYNLIKTPPPADCLQENLGAAHNHIQNKTGLVQVDQFMSQV